MQRQQDRKTRERRAAERRARVRQYRAQRARLRAADWRIDDDTGAIVGADLVIFNPSKRTK